MDARLDYVNRNLKRYDRSLYCVKSRDNVFKILRKAHRFISIGEFSGRIMFDLIESPEYVFSLTDNWKSNGALREWGAEKILERLKNIDIWDDPDFFDKLDQKNDKVEEIKRKDFHNETLAALWDNQRAIRRGFADINTSNLKVTEKAKQSLR